MSTTHYDVAIIGGGINGAGIARELALRNFKVALVEMNDFGSGTSCQSSKLAHGGLRYLEKINPPPEKFPFSKIDFSMLSGRIALDFFKLPV